MDQLVTSMSLPEGVAAHLRTVIHRGEFGPGDRLPPERELAEQLGVARVSLRDAIKMLVDGGYVEVRRGAKGGAFVTELRKPFEQWRAHMREQQHEIDDIIDFRLAVECQAALLAASRRTQHHLRALGASIDRLDGSMSRASFRLADAQFHEGLARAARSPRLETAISSARGELFSPHDVLDFVAPVRETQRDHQAIYESVRDKKSDDAAVAMRRHIERTRKQLRVIVFGSPRRSVHRSGH